MRVIVDSVRALTGPIRDRSHLFVRIRDSVREDDRCKVDLCQTGNGGQGELLILPVEDGGSIRGVGSAVAFRSHMEGSFGVFREPGEEQLEEGIYILSSCGATIDLGTVIGVGVSDIDGLVEEEDIAVCVPRMLVVLHGRLTGDLTRAQLE